MKKLKSFLVFTAVVFIFTGCTKQDISISINEDDTGIINWDFTIPEGTIKRLSEEKTEEFINSDIFKNEIFESGLIRDTNYEKDIVYSLKKDISNKTEMQKTLAKIGTPSVLPGLVKEYNTISDGEHFNVTLTLNAINNLVPLPGFENDVQTEVNLNISLPYPIEEYAITNEETAKVEKNKNSLNLTIDDFSVERTIMIKTNIQSNIELSSINFFFNNDYTGESEINIVENIKGKSLFEDQMEKDGFRKTKEEDDYIVYTKNQTYGSWDEMCSKMTSITIDGRDGTENTIFKEISCFNNQYNMNEFKAITNQCIFNDNIYINILLPNNISESRNGDLINPNVLSCNKNVLNDGEIITCVATINDGKIPDVVINVCIALIAVLSAVVIYITISSIINKRKYKDFVENNIDLSNETNINDILNNEKIKDEN